MKTDIGEKTCRGEDQVRKEAETGVVHPQAKVLLRSPEAGRGEEVLSPKAFGESTTLSTPGFQISGLQNCKRITSNL